MPESIQNAIATSLNNFNACVGLQASCRGQICSDMVPNVHILVHQRYSSKGTFYQKSKLWSIRSYFVVKRDIGRKVTCKAYVRLNCGFLGIRNTAKESDYEKKCI